MPYKITVLDMSAGMGDGYPIYETIVTSPPLVSDAIGATQRALGDMQRFALFGGPLAPEIEIDIRVRKIG